MVVRPERHSGVRTLLVGTRIVVTTTREGNGGPMVKKGLGIVSRTVYQTRAKYKQPIYLPIHLFVYLLSNRDR